MKTWRVALVSALAGLAVSTLTAVSPIAHADHLRVVQFDVEAPSVPQLARSVVMVMIRSGNDLYTYGSGTVISDDGLILTNEHVAVPDVDFEIDGFVIAVTDAMDAPAVPTYRAEVLDSDPGLDLAIMEISESLEGEPYETGAISPVPIGNSDDVQPGDRLQILGYPAIGGATITATFGSVSGYSGDSVLGRRAWFKTDATFSGGNSGGLAANDAGELVGVPTIASSGAAVEHIVDCRRVEDTNGDNDIDESDSCVPIGGFLNGVRPVNLAADMIAAVRGGASYEPIGAEAPTAFDETNVSFGRPLFVDVQSESPPQDDLVWFPGEATQLCAWWEFSGMADGVRFDSIWTVDGIVQERVSNLDEVWSSGESGRYRLCLFAEEALPEGIWDVTLNIRPDAGPSTEAVVKGYGFFGLGDALAPVEFTFSNASPSEVCYLYMSPEVNRTTYGFDLLGPELTLPPGESFTHALPPTSYDILGRDCAQSDLFADKLEISAATTYTYGGESPAQRPPLSTVTASVTAVMTVSDGQGGTVESAYTCSDIAFPPAIENVPNDNVDANTVCTERQEEVFSALVAAEPGGFNDYIYSGEIGVFGSQDVSADHRASVGWWACFGATDGWDVMHYTSEMQRFYPNTSAMDTNAAWEAAFRYICPNLRPTS